jgi:hypothetical protein
MQFHFAASRIESVRNIQQVRRPSLRMTLSSPIPLHQIEVESIEPLTWNDNKVSSFKEAMFAESEKTAEEGVLPPRVFQSASWLSYLIAIHVGGASIRELGRGLFGLSALMGLISQSGCAQLPANDLTEWLALGFAAWMFSVLASYLTGMIWLPIARMRVRRAILLDPV